jgi:hypothetical protein
VARDGVEGAALCRKGEKAHWQGLRPSPGARRPFVTDSLRAGQKNVGTLKNRRRRSKLGRVSANL